jgi:hypothetical protein
MKEFGLVDPNDLEQQNHSDQCIWTERIENQAI